MLLIDFVVGDHRATRQGVWSRTACCDRSDTQGVCHTDTGAEVLIRIARLQPRDCDGQWHDATERAVILSSTRCIFVIVYALE
jgi:hypothetical protein